MRITTRKGLNVPLSGAPDPSIDDGRAVRTVALLGRDYVGLKPRMLIQEGDDVSVGDALFFDKRDPDVMYTALGTGTVIAVNRGERRALLSVVIELDEKGEDAPRFPDLAGGVVDTLDTSQIREVLQTSGQWTAFRSRPFSRVPLSDSEPRSIFVTAIDTNPLAADPSTIVATREPDFEAGLTILTKLTEGPVYLCTDAMWSATTGDSDKIDHAVFSGPHPAGLAGTHIHHLDPVGIERTVWHIGYQDVIAIGELFTRGRISTSRVVAIGGPAVERPRLVTTRLGASIDELTAGELTQGAAVGPGPRVISGSVLSGRKAHGPEAYLGRYHVQVTAIYAGGQRRLLGWLPFRSSAFSYTGMFASRQQRRLEDMTTGSHGRATGIIPVDAFEKVVPLDIATVPLLRALLIKDTDQAQALGCLELDAEDLALCSFVCPGKNDYGTVLGVNLEQIERDG